MYYLSCVFDYRCQPHRPLYATAYNDKTNDIKLYQLFFRGVKFPLFEADKNQEEIKNIIANEQVILSDFHSFISGMRLDIDAKYQVYDTALDREAPSASINELKKQALIGLQRLKNIKPAKWQKILADSQLAYSYLSKIGYYHNYKKRYPTYDLTYSGRSKCLINNIQSTTEEDVIEHINEENKFFIHFDWIAADFRAASLMSEDDTMLASFKESDPYTALYATLNDEAIDREQCKLELFRSLYSLNYDNPALEFYSTFAGWMRRSINEIEISKYSGSILGRQFFLKEDERTLRSVFNAQIQGSVAHAMQNTLYQVYKAYPNNIVTEMHDALILACKQEQLSDIVKEVSQIMLYPLNGIIDSNPKFPLKVSIGLKWKQWKPFKEFR